MSTTASSGRSASPSDSSEDASASSTVGHSSGLRIQEWRSQAAAEAFLRRVVEGQPGEPRVVITDKLASYTPAIQKVLPRAERRRHKGLNNRAENAHVPTRQRERRMRRLKSPDQAQHFLEPFGPINEHFCPKRHLLGAVTYRRGLAQRFEAWRAIVGLAA